MGGTKKGVVSIHGREYTTVSRRVNDFRERYTIADGWAIVTSIVSVSDDSVLMRAEIRDPSQRIVATGYAEDSRTASKIHRTSALETCETSAIGRALAAAGLGGTEYASANEVEVAVAQQKHAERAEQATRWTDKQRAGFCAKLGEIGLNYEEVAAWCESRGRPRPSNMPKEQRAKVLQYLTSGDRTAEVRNVNG